MLIFRFLQIASLAYLCSLIKMVSCQSLSVGLEKGAPAILKNSQDIRRNYKLYNLCSGHHVQIIGKEINARGLSDNANANMSFISARSRHHLNAINIMGQKSGRYVCFNKRGKLIVRFNGRKKLCLFQEDFSKEHYTVLKSLYNPEWYVGFNKKGKPLKGSLHSKSKMESCFHFLKRDHSYGMEQYTPPGPKIKHPWKLKDLLTGGHRSRPQRKVPKTPTR
ncbi:hypothetical protein JTE90_026316 [Oedothorax gibbosus]|uniref:Fibroblast growth factor n=1 Tax=Oedothorax gibbosus TaxID=931172 RepID=A0AAV6U6W9_9ARAC|nr:hypothetical protein JTE90_026316 [Oedothorax gibbosus]